MGSGASAQSDGDDPMYGGGTYSGHPKPAQNPRTRGPRSFEELERSSSHTAPSAPPPDYPGSQRVKETSNTHHEVPRTVKSENRNESSDQASTSKGVSRSVPNKDKAPVVSPSQAAEADGLSDDEIAFETFYHRNGEIYTCMCQGGQRFVMESFATGEWSPFPPMWYDEGFLVTENVLKGGENSDLDEATLMQIVYGKAGLDHMNKGGAQATRVSSQENRDDREGQITHSQRGIIPTYMFEEKRNVHRFFDDYSGDWVELPITWELHSEYVQSLLSQIEYQEPGWQDKHDMLAALRASNYDVQDCIRTRRIVGDQRSMATPRNTLDDKLIKSKDAKIKELEQELKRMTVNNQKSLDQLAVAVRDHKSALHQVSSLQEKVAQLEVEASNAKQKVDGLKQQVEDAYNRPKTAKPVQPQSNVDKQLVRRLANEASLLHQSYHKLRMEVDQGFGDCAKLLQTAVGSAVQLCKLTEMKSATKNEEMEELRTLYRRECLQRKLLYNQLQELRGNIRVFARCRRDDRVQCALTFPSEEDICITDSKNQKRLFRFDRVYDPDTTQEEVFEETCPIVTSCVDGYNVCILAYGQTGSGKTFTMMGPPNNPGVNIRAIKELLRITNERDNVEYQLTVSMIEIYNEVIQDLLTKDCKVVTVQQVSNAVNIQGLSTHPVKTADDITSLMDMGMTNRTVAATKMNSESSRSHLLVMLTVEGRDVSSHAHTKGTLTLVDLAGSERVSKTEASGQRLVEAAAINKSLSSLGQVFAALGKSALHVPYRNSKLTQVLQPSLSGDAKAALFVACSPAESNLSETLSTLQFGSNAKQIELGQAKKNVTKAKNK